MRPAAALPALLASAAAGAAEPGAATPADLRRAEQRAPGARLTAPRGDAVNAAINRHLSATPGLRTRRCEDWAVPDLNRVVRSLLSRRAADLQGVYERRGDARALRSGEAEMERQWAREDGHAAVRDVRCAEAAMVFSHHLSRPAREAAARDHVLPLLPAAAGRRHPDLARQQMLAASLAGGASCQSGHAGMEDDACTAAVWGACGAACGSFDACVAAANASAPAAAACGGYDGVWKACSQAPPGTQNNGPHHEGGKPWPAEVAWEGQGYGVYPFWSHLATPRPDITVGHAIKTHWSSTKNAELFEHAKCQMDLVGYTGGDVACKHLFIGEYAWFYTAAEDWCCLSGDKQSRQGFGPLTAPQRNWTQALQYVGTAQHKTLFYDGQIKNYTVSFTFPPFVFWYYTDMQDRPIEQGEGCQVSPRTANCNGPTYLWHNYNPDKFNETTIDWSVFTVPDVCQGTTNYCLFP